MCSFDTITKLQHEQHDSKWYTLARCKQWLLMSGPGKVLTNVEARTVCGIIHIKHIYIGRIIRIYDLCLLEELDACSFKANSKSCTNLTNNEYVAAAVVGVC